MLTRAGRFFFCLVRTQPSISQTRWCRRLGWTSNSSSRGRNPRLAIPNSRVTLITRVTREQTIKLDEHPTVRRVRQKAEARPCPFRPRGSDGETKSMWQSLSFKPGYKAAYCISVCPAGEDVISPFLASALERQELRVEGDMAMLEAFWRCFPD